MARIAYMYYTKKLGIFNILNFFCVVYVHSVCSQLAHIYIYSYNLLDGSTLMPRISHLIPWQ